MVSTEEKEQQTTPGWQKLQGVVNYDGMNVLNLLVQMRAGWVARVSRHMARGAGVRESFLAQLNQFYDAVLQSVESGDPHWLDTILQDWAASQTDSTYTGEETDLYRVLSEIIHITQEFLQESLPPEENVEVMAAILPLITYAYGQTGRHAVRAQNETLRRELEIAQQALEHLDRSKSDFISVAAHELKTPLTLIEGYAAMIREIFPKEDESSREVLLLKGIDNGTLRLREIIDDMIDVSLIDNNLLALSFQPLWINRLLATLGEELREPIATRRQKLEIKAFPGSDEMTFGDAERIYQALRNLLTNAIKYTPDGGRITVSGHKLPGFIEVTITDTGIGIEPEDHARIFQKFAQVGNVSLHSSGKTKYKGGGPGLGLPITKGIIEAHGGTIWVESDRFDDERFPGSTFHVMLPLWKEPPDQKTASLFKPLFLDEN